jgi:hypothetical protein
LVDAYHIPKLLSQQLLPFGRSGDGLERLTFEVKLFSALSARRGQSASTWRTVREQVADSSRHVSSSRVLRVLAQLLFRSVVALGFRWARFRTVRSSGRTVRGCLADSPRAPHGRSVIRCRLWRFCLLFRTVRGEGPDGPRCVRGQSAEAGWTVRVACADGPSLLAGRSARACALCFLVRFLPSSLVLPRVLQGIVPKTRG